ncbi:MAG: methyltransferase domain-containing protein [Parachlamydiales bacterium]
MMKKSYELEALDTGDYTPEEYDDCLLKLGQIGEYLGGDENTLKAFKGLSPTSILDVGCGGGYFTALLAKTYPQAQVTGIDLSEAAIAFAQKTQPKLPNLTFKVQQEKSLAALEPVDVVTATLVCHHMGDEELVQFLKEAKALAKQKVILSDLHRSPIAYASFEVASRLFHNRLITQDGLLSIRRAFTRREWGRYLTQGAITSYQVRWRWPFRWIVTF